MSKDDDYNDELMEELVKDNRDKYIQGVIEFLEDPDYEGIPIVTDGENIIYPEGGKITTIIKALKSTVKWFKKKLYEED